MFLKSFQDYLTEARMTEANLEKFVKIFAKIFTRETNAKLFRLGGDTGTVEIAGGLGIVFLYDFGGRKQRAVRFNYIKGELVSLSVWNHYNFADADYTVDLRPLNVLNSAKEIIRFLTQQLKPGTYQVADDLTEAQDETLTEAKRLKAPELIALVRNELGEKKVKYVSHTELSNLLTPMDIQVPVALKNVIVGKAGKENFYDLSQLVHGVEVKAGDKLTGAAGTSVSKLEIVKQTELVKQAISAPEPSEQEMKHPDSLFNLMGQLSEMVVKGKKNSLIIYGGPGIGKTHTVRQVIQKNGLVEKKDWFMIKGKVTTASLYQSLYMLRKGALIVMDDTDSVWGDQDAANVLKAALDSYDVRTVSWISGRTLNVGKMTKDQIEEYQAEVDAMIEDDPSNPKIKLPSEFEFEGRIIFISNLAREKFDEAVLNRSAKIDMTLNRAQMFIRMESILPHLGPKNVSLDEKKEVLEFVKSIPIKNPKEIPSMRTFVNAMDAYTSGYANWKELVDFM